MHLQQRISTLIIVIKLILTDNNWNIILYFIFLEKEREIPSSEEMSPSEDRCEILLCQSGENPLDISGRNAEMIWLQRTSSSRSFLYSPTSLLSPGKIYNSIVKMLIHTFRPIFFCWIWNYQKEPWTLFIPEMKS